MSRLFSISRSHFRSFFLSLGIFSCLFFTLCGSYRGILVVFWSSRTLKCARGDSHDSPRAKTRTVPADQNTTKIPREDPQREKKRRKWGWEKKKKRNFAADGWRPDRSRPDGCLTECRPVVWTTHHTNTPTPSGLTRRLTLSSSVT